MSMIKEKEYDGLPTKYEKLLMKEISKDFDSSSIGIQMKVDGKKLFLLQIIFGNMSSSMMLKILIDRYGFNEIQNDIDWLKKIEVK